MAIYDNSDIIARSRANETASMLTTADSLGGTREFNWENNVRETYTTTSTLAIALPTLGSRREVRIHTSTAAYIKFGNSAVGAATVGQGNMKSPPEAPDVIKIPAGHTHFRVIGETAGGNISITAAACGMGIGQLAASGAVSANSDLHYANVSLLLNGDGADNGTVFTDNSPSQKTVTAYGNAKTSTAQSKFGGSSIAFDGSGDYLSVPGSSGEFSFGTGDFTIEFWARWSSITSEDAICFGYGIGWTLFIYPAGKLQWGRISPQSPANLLESESSVTTGQWHHIAVTRESGVVKFWIDGNASGSVSDTANYSATGTLNIGKSHAGGWFHGWIDDFRITKGVARYTGNFTPPTEAFSKSSADN